MTFPRADPWQHYSIACKSQSLVRRTTDLQSIHLNRSKPRLCIADSFNIQPNCSVLMNAYLSRHHISKFCQSSIRTFLDANGQFDTVTWSSPSPVFETWLQMSAETILQEDTATQVQFSHQHFGCVSVSLLFIYLLTHPSYTKCISYNTEGI